MWFSGLIVTAAANEDPSSVWFASEFLPSVFRCGYCDQIDPAIDHVSTVHWKRLSKSMPLKKKVEPTAESAPNNVTKADAEENTGQSRIAVEIELQDVNGAVAMEQSSAESACVTSSESSSDLETEGESCLEEGAASAKDADNPDRCVVSPTPNPAQEQSYVNVVLSVPDDVVDEFRFGERLPPEFQRLFPELATARVMQISAKLLGGKDDVVTFDLMAECQIRHLKRKLADEFLLPFGSFKVLNAGKPLHDDEVELPAAGLKDGAKLTVVINSGEAADITPEMESRMKVILGELATPINMLRLQRSIQNYVNFMSLDDINRFARKREV
ncbi:unnamed protein product [Nippostrongylus brasiliensis]|uniref:Ubiquitin-like domain-containing protein n=1 Tax=Nippostrongylus brasiliensis TaxID=27835 RepID=A0A158R2N3_NIPBR|nr:unnamed protein product [Nippostrongylus brasiliensis]